MGRTGDWAPGSRVDQALPGERCSTPGLYYIFFPLFHYVPSFDLFWVFCDAYLWLFLFLHIQNYVSVQTRRGLKKKWWSRFSLIPRNGKYRFNWIRCAILLLNTVYHFIIEHSVSFYHWTQCFILLLNTVCHFIIEHGVPFYHWTQCAILLLNTACHFIIAHSVPFYYWTQWVILL